MTNRPFEKSRTFSHIPPVCEQYLKKGSKVYLEGQLQTRKWQDKSGNDRYSTEVTLQGFNSKLIMLDGRSDGSGDYSSGTSSSDAPTSSFPDDEIPF